MLLAITVDTKLVALFGNPLGQSYSSRFHNSVYAELGLDCLYIPVELESGEHLGKVVDAVRLMNFAGFAITKPFKEEIIPYLDEVDNFVKLMGSCNTVVAKSGKLVGYNTDGIGAITSLKIQGGISIEWKTYFIIGAGGTGKSVGFELAAHGAKRIYMVDTDERAKMCEELVAHINSVYEGVCVAMRQDDINKGVADSDVLLNLSGLGMTPYENETPLDKNAFEARHLCFDAIYNPQKTVFLQDAEKAGCKTVNGMGMLAYQAARQIQLWMGVDEPTEPTLRHLEQLVKETTN